MLLLVTYDVNTQTPEGKRRLRLVAKACTAYGQRVQNSVFECVLEQAQYVKLRHTLEGIADPATDSLRFYNLGDKYKNRVVHFGAKPTYDPESPMIL